MSSSGGLVYHFKAFKHEKALWQSHQIAVAQFLKAWNPHSSSLLLVGPSAGYSLPDDFLNRFSKITAVEPDPLARLLFRLRHQSKVEWISKGFDFTNSAPLALPPSTAVLFCNLLGQIQLPAPGKVAKNLKHFLAGREWASYHDALSGDHLEFDTEDAGSKKALASEMESWIFLKKKNLPSLEIVAHQAPSLFYDEPSLRFAYWQWRITPTRSHLIEGVYFSKPIES